MKTGGGFIHVCSAGLAGALRGIKCCFVAAVSCPAIVYTVQRAEGEIKVKATCTRSCSTTYLELQVIYKTGGENWVDPEESATV